MSLPVLENLIRISEERLLNMLVRNRNHKDYGFFCDYDSVMTDPTLQCLVNPLSQLVTDKNLNSQLYGEEIPLRWARFSLLNTLKIQQKNGAYGDKKSQEWTGLLLYHNILAYRKLTLLLEEGEKITLESSFLEAGKYLYRNHPKNPLRKMESALALYELFRLTGDRKVEEISGSLVYDLFKSQHTDGNMEDPEGFNVRRHFNFTEQLSRYHFLHKTDLTRGLLKGCLHLLLQLQRPDGTLENEIFDGEDYLTAPGYLIHMLKEMPDANQLVNGLIQGAVIFGHRVLPYLQRRAFAMTTPRLFSTFELLRQEENFKITNKMEEESTHHFKGLNLVSITTPHFRVFVNPAVGRIKIYSRQYSAGQLLYADSGFRITIDDQEFMPQPLSKDHQLTISKNRITFSTAVSDTQKSGIFRKGQKIMVEREIDMQSESVILTSRFLLEDFSWEKGTLYRIYDRLNRNYCADNIHVPSRESLTPMWTMIQNKLTQREVVEFQNFKWQVREDNEEITNKD